MDLLLNLINWKVREIQDVKAAQIASGSRNKKPATGAGSAYLWAKLILSCCGLNQALQDLAQATPRMLALELVRVS